MASNWTTVDATFPTFRGDETPQQQITALINYMQVLTEQLKYSLDNLDSDNWNTAALQSLADNTADSVVEKATMITKHLEQVRNDVAALNSKVSEVSALPGRVSVLEDDVSYLEKEVSEFTGRMDATEASLGETQGDVVILEQTAKDHEDRLAAVEGLIDTAEADIDELQESASNHDERLNVIEPKMDEAKGDIDKLQENVAAAEQRLGAIEAAAENNAKSIAVTETGATIGGEGQVLNLVGTIYINGVLCGQESET